MNFIKLFWSIDKSYTIIFLISTVLLWVSLFKGDFGFSSWQGLLMYIAFNELRYKYDDKNNFKN